MSDIADSSRTDTPSARGTLSLVLGIAAILGLVLAVVVTGNDDEPGWLWLISPLFGLGALVVGLSARQGGRFGTRAIIGMVIGALALLNLIAWTIAG